MFECTINKKQLRLSVKNSWIWNKQQPTHYVATIVEALKSQKMLELAQQIYRGDKEN